MNLQSIVKEIQEKTVIANDDLMDATNSTRAMRQGNKRAATERLVDLKDQYRNVLMHSTAFILVTGSQANDLVSLASPENKSFGVNAEDLYTNIVSKIDSRAYMNQTIASSIVNNIDNAMFEISKEIGVARYPELRFKAEYQKMITSQDQFLEVVKNIINDSLGSEMVGIYSINTVLEEALKRGHSDSFTPVLMSVSDDKLLNSLAKDLVRLNSNVFLASVGKGQKNKTPGSISIKEASPEALEQLLEAIKGKV